MTATDLKMKVDQYKVLTSRIINTLHENEQK